MPNVGVDPRKVDLSWERWAKSLPREKIRYKPYYIACIKIINPSHRAMPPRRLLALAGNNIPNEKLFSLYCTYVPHRRSHACTKKVYHSLLNKTTQRTGILHVLTLIYLYVFCIPCYSHNAWWELLPIPSSASPYRCDVCASRCIPTVHICKTHQPTVFCFYLTPLVVLPLPYVVYIPNVYISIRLMRMCQRDAANAQVYEANSRHACFE